MLENIRISFACILLLAANTLFSDTYSLDQSIKGYLSESPPWAYVSIYSVNSNTLNIELNPFNLSTDSYVRYWYLNFTNKLNVNQLKFSAIGGDSNTEPSVSTGVNSFSLSEAGKFDIRVHFPEAEQQRFFGGETVLLEVTSVNPIDPSMFHFGSYTNNADESYYSALEANKGYYWKKVSIGSNSTVAIPEPSTYLILASMLFFAVLAISRSQNRELSKSRNPKS